MTDPRSQQTGGETVGATSNATQSASSTSAPSPGSPEAQIAIPQIIIQPADNSDARRPAQRADRVPRSDRNFLEVPSPPQPRDLRLPSHPRRPPQARRPFGPGNLPLSLTGPVEAFHVAIDPLRMHPTGLVSSSTMPATTAAAPPLGSRFDGNPYTPKGREVMAKVEDMLAADKALKGDPEAGGGSKIGRLFKKLKSPASIFSRGKPKGPIKPHQIRHVRSLEPLSTAAEIPPVPSPHLRQNERINVQKREKALLILGDTPRFSTLSPAGPSSPAPAHTPPPSSSSAAEDPFSESPPEAARAPTAFETRLGGTKSAAALLSRAATPDPFQTSRVMASRHDSLLPDDPTAASTPQRRPAAFAPAPAPVPAPGSRAFVGAQGSPTKGPRTTAAITTTTTPTTTTAPTAPTAPTTTLPAPATPQCGTNSSPRAPSQSRTRSPRDRARGARPQHRHARPCADDAGSDGAGVAGWPAAAAADEGVVGVVSAAGAAVVGGAVPAAAAPVAAAAQRFGGAVAVPRVALSPRVGDQDGRRRGGVWDEEGDEDEEEDQDAEEGGEEEEEVPWWEDGEDGEGERERRRWEERGGMRGFGFAAGSRGVAAGVLGAAGADVGVGAGAGEVGGAGDVGGGR